MTRIQLQVFDTLAYAVMAVLKIILAIFDTVLLREKIAFMKHAN